MVKNERFITFPAPEWNLPYVKNNNDDFYCYCVCYQYDFDDSGYGPYGLTTNSAANLVGDFFKDGLLTYSESHKNKLALHKFSSRKGLYLFSRKKRSLIYITNAHYMLVIWSSLKYSRKEALRLNRHPPNLWCFRIYKRLNEALRILLR